MDSDVLAILARLTDALEKQTEILKALAARSGTVQTLVEEPLGTAPAKVETK